MSDELRGTPPAAGGTSLPTSLRLPFKIRLLNACALPRFPGAEIRGKLGQGIKLAHCLAAKDGGQAAEECQDCPPKLQSSCAYSRLFRPPQRGAKAPPSPFGLEVPWLTHGKGALASGQTLGVALTLYGSAADEAAWYLEALALAGRRHGLGWGPRSRFEVLFDRVGHDDQVGDEWYQRRVAALSEADALVVELTSPLCLRESKRVVTWFDLDRFLRYAYERLERLERAYGSSQGAISVSTPPVPVRGVGVKVATTRRVAFQRRRSDGTRQPMEGIVGRIVLSGDIDGVLPLLVAAERFQVGKDTSFGFGVVRLSPHSGRERRDR